MPSLTYIPFLLTGDPYYLEELQFWANKNMLALPSNSRFMVAGRYLAWPTRAIAEAYRATPEAVPNWLLPKSYWKTWLDQCRGYIETRAANSSDPFMYLFHTVQEPGQDSDKDPVPSGDHVWQQNMLELVAAWLASWTPTGWRRPSGCCSPPWRAPRPPRAGHARTRRPITCACNMPRCWAPHCLPMR